MSRLVDDLLFIARTDTNNLRLECAKTNIHDLITDCCQDMRHQAKAKSMVISFHPVVEPAYAMVDAERIRQLLIIVLDNAIKYSPAETQVQINTSIDEHNILIHVADQGHGLEQSELPFIFDRFYRSQKVRRESLPGTGLGLAVAKAITDAHQGKIWAQVDDTGFRITISLPRVV
ncbi:sensor histidine kinase [Methylophaga thalassica]|uniref:sensor histidine kinase n=1 Tax=Methylophaga thalassica TaxID=40223 RepID=UPI003622484A